MKKYIALLNNSSISKMVEDGGVPKIFENFMYDSIEDVINFDILDNNYNSMHFADVNDYEIFEIDYDAQNERHPILGTNTSNWRDRVKKLIILK